jgi:hypothetical protein
MTDIPSKQLAKRIIDKFVGEGVLSPADAEKMLDKLATGKLKGEDWQLSIDLAGSKGAKS